ncbi:hypothetical protein NIES267_56910 [Calothrix parasitica NIES-267]|uniref:Uncharacterized protein n=1 Tax=Calothrix parasitica NIES-267 TaxID=1973488 RepID=A0A1Z4LY56_9CYAN|nr:hypothetical protein NIES267_56910 [Calothrix parasitica NIES-267]
MDIRNSFDITVSESLIKRLQETKSVAKQGLNNFSNNFTDKAEQVRSDWQQTATQSTEHAVDTFNNALENAKGSLEENLPQVSVQDVVNSSIKNWFEQHPAFSGIINSLNWAVNHPIISLIIIIFSLAILWNLVKLIGRLIEKASLSILQIPLNLFQTLIKYSWLSLIKFGNFAKNKYTNTKNISNINNKSELQLNNNRGLQIIADNKQQRLKDISARLEAIQIEQQELLQEAADIIDAEKSHSSIVGQRLEVKG